MIINKKGESFEYEGKKYTIGSLVYANSQSDYQGLWGHIKEIRDGDDKTTENLTPDIHCEFMDPIAPVDVKAIEKHFSELYGEEKKLSDICLDKVIMAPDMLLTIEEATFTNNADEVFAIIEEWSIDGNGGSDTEVYSDHEYAKIMMRLQLHKHVDEGWLLSWLDDSSFVTDFNDDLFEIYEDGYYIDNHYSIRIKKLTLHKRQIL